WCGRISADKNQHWTRPGRIGYLLRCKTVDAGVGNDDNDTGPSNRGDENGARRSPRPLRNAIRDRAWCAFVHASDPIEWVHCHIARQPVPPCDRLADVPEAVSSIVMELLSKTPKSGYLMNGISHVQRIGTPLAF